MTEMTPKRANKALVAFRELWEALCRVCAELPPTADGEDLLRGLKRQGLRVHLPRKRP